MLGFLCVSLSRSKPTLHFAEFFDVFKTTMASGVAPQGKVCATKFNPGTDRRELTPASCPLTFIAVQISVIHF